MASTSSREAALERRKALNTGGKKAAGRFTSGPSRVRSAADARPSRTTDSVETVAAPAAAPVAAPAVQASRPSRSLSAGSSSPRRSHGVRVSNPSRDLVLARREALSRGGKRADTSKDRTRTDLARGSANAAVKVAPAPVSSPSPTAESKPCGCNDTSSSRSAARLSLGSSSGGSERRGEQRKGTAQHNPSRALVLARREALSKRGKSASTASKSGPAAVARQINPELNGRELAQKVRELRSKSGSAGSSRSGGTRPSGPNRHGAKQAAAADAHWKVGVSETTAGQVVTGTQANRSAKTTGNEAATCRPITGTEYLGAEVFQTFCNSGPAAAQPAKVRVTATSHGNRVTGNEVGRSDKVTGDEPGTCKNVTGTEYVSANQSAAYCGGANPSPRKVGRSQTLGGQAVSGVMVGRSSKVTGDEPGSGLQLTGDQYLGAEPPTAGRAPTKVASQHTLRGTGVTGTAVGRSQHVTGDEPGSCRNITGDEYIGAQQFGDFCGAKPAPEAAKVGFSVTNRNQVVSGTRTGRSANVTGDEPGTCKVVTGTPYAGLEQASDYCATASVRAVRERTPQRGASRMSGIQPGIGGQLTGASRGACEDITGTPYVGADQLAQACGAASTADADFPQPLNQAPWQQFSIQSPARAAHTARQRGGGVTGTSYEQGSRITGPFDMAGDKVTGTEQFRFDRRGAQLARGPIEPAADTQAPERPVSRVTGEGITAGLRITGDDWDRNERVTGTEGASARRRNPTRTGPMPAMAMVPPKRNDEVPEPVSRVTGSSGNTTAGSLITVSGGARG
ncbi:MAG: CsoS2 family carboxysome shell protein [Cyanobacteriota bacterium]|nr:CsoS2 family carboxysome shell protein [Cyanobacteriota bacterium]